MPRHLHRRRLVQRLRTALCKASSHVLLPACLPCCRRRPPGNWSSSSTRTSWRPAGTTSGGLPTSCLPRWAGAAVCRGGRGAGGEASRGGLAGLPFLLALPGCCSSLCRWLAGCWPELAQSAPGCCHGLLGHARNASKPSAHALPAPMHCLREVGIQTGDQALTVGPRVHCAPCDGAGAAPHDSASRARPGTAPCVDGRAATAGVGRRHRAPAAAIAAAAAAAAAHRSVSLPQHLIGYFC